VVSGVPAIVVSFHFFGQLFMQPYHRNEGCITIRAIEFDSG